MQIRVSRDPKFLSKLLSDPLSDFPLSSVRLLNLNYYAARFGKPFVDDSFAILVGEETICVAVRTIAEDKLAFFDEPYRVEFSSFFLKSEGCEAILKQISNELWDSKQKFRGMELEIPIAQESTNVLFERILPFASRHSHLAEVEVLLEGQSGSEQTLRKSHKQSIRKGLEMLSDPQTHFGEITSEEFKEYKELHFLAAGRVTRSDRSWDEQYRAILDARGMLVTARLGPNLVGATFSWLSPSCGYYVSGAYDRSLFRTIPISHVTVQHSIEKSQELGCRIYIVGDGYYIGGNQKEKSIGLFKRGFSSQRTHYHTIVAAD